MAELNSIRVAPLKPVVEFESGDDAIEHARQLQTQKIKDLSERLAGLEIAEIEVGNSATSFHFANEECLEIKSSPTGVQWEVAQSRPGEDSTGSLAPVISLNFGEPVGIIDWKVESLVQKIRGSRFKKLSKSELGLFVYVESNPALLFVPMKILSDSPTDETLLFWDFAA